jgi:hypothetical protein
MIELSITTDFKGLEAKLKSIAEDMPQRAARVALTRTVAAARRDVMAEIRKVFDEPTPFTVNSIRYEMATHEQPEAKVFVSDDAAKGLSPRKYLLAEIEGGSRGLKRGEKALIAAGLMGAGQRMMPGKDMVLNQYGNIPGPRMVQLLSRLSAFGQQGYRANVSEATKRRMKRAKLAVASTRTDVFIGHAKNGGGALGVYQLLGRGHVGPVLAFANKAPVYKARFDFHGVVARSAAVTWPAEMAKAMKQVLDGGVRVSS